MAERLEQDRCETEVGCEVGGWKIKNGVLEKIGLVMRMRNERLKKAAVI